MARIWYFEISWMLDVVLTFPSSKNDMKSILFYFNIFTCIRTIPHASKVQEQRTISFTFVWLLCHKMTFSHTKCRDFLITILQYFYFSSKMLSQIINYFFFAQGITINVKFKTFVGEPFLLYHLQQLVVDNLLSRKIFSWCCKCIVKVKEI